MIALKGVEVPLADGLLFCNQSADLEPTGTSALGELFSQENSGMIIDGRGHDVAPRL